MSLERYSSSVTGIESSQAGYETKQVNGGLRVETLGVMKNDRSFFINAVWPADSFASRSQWSQVIIQHLRLPMTLFAAVLLCGLLSFVVVRIFGKRRAIRVVA
jgi:hypothetical protein